MPIVFNTISAIFINFNHLNITNRHTKLLQIRFIDKKMALSFINQTLGT